MAAETNRTMTQTAPYPEILAELVAALKYRPGWRFGLRDFERDPGSAGLTFEVIGVYPDSYNPEETIRVAHYFPVPPATYDERSWRRWIFARLIEIETHEAAEFFQIGSERPYAPLHQPGSDPYGLVPTEMATDVERKTNFRGEVG